MKILGRPGLEISIPSTLKHETTSYVVITRQTERFVDELHDFNSEFRSSTELLSAFQAQDPAHREGFSWPDTRTTSASHLGTKNALWLFGMLQQL